MKKNIFLYFYALSIWTCILIARDQTGNPFDAAIRQIDTQSKELNQQIVRTQQDGLSNQRTQRLELELETIKSEHAQEIATLKKNYEEQIDALKKEVVNAKQAHVSCASSIKKLKKEGEDVRQELAQLQSHNVEISTLKNTIEILEKELKEYSNIKAPVIQVQQEGMPQNPLNPIMSQ